MPFVLVLIGLMIGVSAYRGTQSDLWQLVAGDFTGQGSFIYWLVAIAVVGGVGYIPSIKPVSDAFIVLILLVFILSNRGFFNQFQTALASADATATPAPADATQITGIGVGSSSGSTGSSNSGGFSIGDLLPALPLLF